MTRKGVIQTREGNWIDLDLEEVKKLLREGKNIREIAKIYNCKNEAITALARNKGTTITRLMRECFIDSEKKNKFQIKTDTPIKLISKKIPPVEASMHLDFTYHNELYEFLAKLARHEMRSIEDQVIYMLDQYRLVMLEELAKNDELKKWEGL